MRSKYYIVFCLLFASMLCNAQTEEQSNLEELLLEQLAENLAEDINISELIERLNYYQKHPLNLNTVSETDLMNLVFLTAQQVENLLYHRQISGDFISILELQAVRGFTAKNINLLQNFIVIENASRLKDISVKGILTTSEQSIMTHYGRVLEKQKGYAIEDKTKSHYLGDPNRYALRYRWNFENKVKIALNMEKDAGEPFFKEKQRYGFDFYSGHIEFNNLNKRIKKVVLGDYSLQFGQGLVLWNGLSFGKGTWIGSVARQGVGLKGYSSMNENYFQRGIASKIEFGNIEWTPFIAYNSLSGKVEGTDSTDNLISTISLTGLHRTATELSYRNKVKQLIYGSNVSYRYKRLKLGLTYMGAHFNGRLLRGNAVRHIFDFEGKSLQQIGVSYQTTYRNLYIFGETAHSFDAGFATLNGLIASLHPKLSSFATYRNYGRDYHSFHAQSLGESSSVSNESGIYTGLVFHPSRKIEWMNYVDVFKFPWLRFRVDAPSQGTDFLSQLTHTWYKKGNLAFRYRHRLRQENISLDGSNTNILAAINRNQFRIDFQYKWTDRWRTRTRAELSLFDKEQSSKSSGFLAYQDIFWKGLNKWSFNIRLAYFNTNDFDSRIYAYENDVLYASSFPVYYDKGIRTYFNTRWGISKNIDFWLRYALSYYPNQETVGSGLEGSEGKKHSDIKVQLRWEW